VYFYDNSEFRGEQDAASRAQRDERGLRVSQLSNVDEICIERERPFHQNSVYIETRVADSAVSVE
jgi:hypothetical protein